MAEVPLPTPTDNQVPSTDIRDTVYAGAMLDKVVTSTELTYTDRLGGEHYTVDGIKAEGDKVVEETRQNLIPLSRQYMTLADAQADIANIPEGSTTYVRSADGNSLADEYINNGGTLEATGRQMPSQVYIDSLLSIIQQMQNQSLYRDGVAGFSFPVISADKRVIGFKNDGGVYVADVEIPGTDKIPPRDGPQYISVVKSKNDGRVGIGFNPKNGLTFALLDDDSVSYIADRIGGGGTIPDIRGQWGRGYLIPDTISATNTIPLQFWTKVLALSTLASYLKERRIRLLWPRHWLQQSVLLSFMVSQTPVLAVQRGEL